MWLVAAILAAQPYRIERGSKRGSNGSPWLLAIRIVQKACQKYRFWA